MHAHSTSQFYGTINIVEKKKIKSYQILHCIPLRNAVTLCILSTELNLSTSVKSNQYSKTSFHNYWSQKP